MGPTATRRAVVNLNNRLYIHSKGKCVHEQNAHYFEFTPQWVPSSRKPTFITSFLPFCFSSFANYILCYFFLSCLLFCNFPVFSSLAYCQKIAKLYLCLSSLTFFIFANRKTSNKYMLRERECVFVCVCVFGCGMHCECERDNVGVLG